MANVTEIPLLPSQAQRLDITLGGTAYKFRLTYDIAQDGCWVLDIGDVNGNILVAGIPLVSGVDLLAQYAYMEFGGSLFVTTDRGAGEVPTFAGLGQTSHLFFVANA